MSLFAAKKVLKEKGQDPEAFELDVAQVPRRSVNQSAPPQRAKGVTGALQLPTLSACDACVGTLRAQALCDLEANSNDLKAELRELYITSAKEVDVTGRKAVVIFVPFKLLKVVHKIQSRLVRELEKKFSGKHVVLIGQRCTHAPLASSPQSRPRLH